MVCRDEILGNHSIFSILSAFMMHGVLDLYEDKMVYLLGEYIMAH